MNVHPHLRYASYYQVSNFRIRELTDEMEKRSSCNGDDEVISIGSTECEDEDGSTVSGQKRRNKMTSDTDCARAWPGR